MNKKIFIVIGTILVLLIVGVWVYLFFSGDTSKTDGVFAGFGDGGNSNDVVFEDNGFVGNENIITPTTQRLRQITLRPVAGAVIVDNGILFVEQGTGHVFHINLDTGNETLMSGTTLVGAWNAVFSPDGVYVAITSGFQDGGDIVVGSISPDGGLEGVSLPKNSSQVWFGDDNNLYYLAKDARGSRGYVYDVQKASAIELFNTPLRDVRVIWGDDIYVYTTPSATQEGYIYKVVENKFEFVTVGGDALMGFSSGEDLILTKTVGSRSYTQILGNNNLIFGSLLPEKCVGVLAVLICAIPEKIDVGEFPDLWYKGMVSYTDSLWRVDIENGNMLLLSNFLQESGREIDVSKVGTNNLGSVYWFVNKNDNSLWLFDVSL